VVVTGTTATAFPVPDQHGGILWRHGGHDPDGAGGLPLGDGGSMAVTAASGVTAGGKLQLSMADNSA